mmetsp:Transcript_10342/g.22101  ORF Transcript_10342/g.22101 Transcript_10342/m.22101 type:complete len:281 (-) Transcript_10342:711-1553(-)
MGICYDRLQHQAHGSQPNQYQALGWLQKREKILFRVGRLGRGRGSLLGLVLHPFLFYLLAQGGGRTIQVSIAWSIGNPYRIHHGQTLMIPAKDRNAAAFDYCIENWCVEENQSIITYGEGLTFEDYKCQQEQTYTGVDVDKCFNKDEVVLACKLRARTKNTSLPARWRDVPVTPTSRRRLKPLKPSKTLPRPAATRTKTFGNMTTPRRTSTEIVRILVPDFPVPPARMPMGLHSRLWVPSLRIRTTFPSDTTTPSRCWSVETSAANPVLDSRAAVSFWET